MAAPSLAIDGRAARDVRVQGRLVAQALALAGGDALALEAPALELALEGPGVPGERAELSAHAPALGARVGTGSLTVEAIAGELYGVAFRATAEVAEIRDGPRLAGRLELAPFSPRELMQRLGVAYLAADPTALAGAELAAAYALDAQGLRLSEVRLRLDDTTVTGTLALASPAPPAVRFDLAADRVALDRYRAAAATGTMTGITPEALRALDLEGTLEVADVRYAGIRSTQVGLRVR
jgi:AsmA protein